MSELFEKLGIDWKLLIAQVINFGILFWILKKYAYKPILGALEKRSTTIAKSLDDAKQIDQQVKALETEKHRVLTEARRQAGEIVEQARRDSQAFAAKAREQAQSEAGQIVVQAKQDVGQMKDQAMAEAKTELAELVVTATEKVVRMKIEGAADIKMVEQALRQSEKQP